MRSEKYDVIYEHTNSGVPGGTEIIATFTDINEAQAVALALNEHHGYKGEYFEGAGDVEGYYVRVCLIGERAVYFAQEENKDWLRYWCGICQRWTDDPTCCDNISEA